MDCWSLLYCNDLFITISVHVTSTFYFIAYSCSQHSPNPWLLLAERLFYVTCSKALYNDQLTPSGPEAYIWVQVTAASNQSMYAGTHFTDSGRMESRVNFSGKEGHLNIQPSTRPGRIEPGTSELGGRYPNHCVNPSATSTVYQY